MNLVISLLESVIYGIVQGITEWLPISSTGHLILMNTFMPLNVYSDAASNEAFWNMYKVVIQFGSILAVLLLYWKKLWPFRPGIKPERKQNIFRLWMMIIIACIPAGIAGVLLNDIIDEVLSSSFVIAITLILYGLLFIWMESRKHTFTITNTAEIGPMDALKAGLFQALALIPGTSRSGATIFGETLLGFNRSTAAEFSFYMALPVMAGASLLKIIKADIAFNANAILVLIIGLLVSFIVSIIVIRTLMSYIRKHDFKIFGVYRIILGIIVLIFCFTGLLA